MTSYKKCEFDQMWHIENGQNIDETKKSILKMLEEQKITLSQTEYLFESLLYEIRCNNPITYHLEYQVD